MMLAEATGPSQLEIWMLIGQLLMAIGTIGALVLMAAAFNKKQNVAFKQPVSVTISEELHKVFAAKEAFENHIAENKKEHENFYSKIGGVERGAAANLAGRFDKISSELTEQGKDIAGLKKETELQNQTLAAVQADIKRILGRLPRGHHEE